MWWGPGYWTIYRRRYKGDKVKKIGDTNEGGVLVEMTRQEWQALISLNDVADGMVLSPMVYGHFGQQEAEFEPVDVLNAIISWIDMKDSFNRLLQSLQDMNEGLTKEATTDD